MHRADATAGRRGEPELALRLAQAWAVAWAVAAQSQREARVLAWAPAPRQAAGSAPVAWAERQPERQALPQAESAKATQTGRQQQSLAQAGQRVRWQQAQAGVAAS
ncbi:MAG: hypothetical protein ACRCXM_09970, partial [Beijerinckiaceae bacterium]